MVWGKIILSHTMGQFIYVRRVAERLGSGWAFPIWKRTEVPSGDVLDHEANGCRRMERWGAADGSWM
jgi:hypothetical protein